MDLDGDSLVYELYQPFNSYIGEVGAQLQNTAGTTNPKPKPEQFLPPPFIPITWAYGYSTDLQINSTGSTIIDRKTGRLNFTPTHIGQFVVGISVKEYRDGQLINITRRDFQFNVSHCVFEVVASFTAPDKNCDPNVKFSNNSSGNGQLLYNWDFGDKQDLSDQSTVKSPNYKYRYDGRYNAKLVVKNGICSDTYSRPVTILPIAKPNLGPDDTIHCANLMPVLDAGDGVSYEWQDGTEQQTFTTQNEGTFYVKVEDKNGCINSDTIIISKGNQVFNPTLYMPNAFSPNNDGINDLFPQNQFTDTSAFYNLQIFNRWGEKIAQYDSPLDGWDGKYKGQQQKEGVYVYLVYWKGCEGLKRHRKGNITLMK